MIMILCLLCSNQTQNKKHDRNLIHFMENVKDFCVIENYVDVWKLKNERVRKRERFSKKDEKASWCMNIKKLWIQRLTVIFNIHEHIIKSNFQIKASLSIHSKFKQKKKLVLNMQVSRK